MKAVGISFVQFCSQRKGGSSVALRKCALLSQSVSAAKRSGLLLWGGVAGERGGDAKIENIMGKGVGDEVTRLIFCLTRDDDSAGMRGGTGTGSIRSLLPSGDSGHQKAIGKVYETFMKHLYSFIGWHAFVVEEGRVAAFQLRCVAANNCG